MTIHRTDPSNYYFAIINYSLEGLSRYRQVLKAYLTDLETAGAPAASDATSAEIVRGWIQDTVLRSTLADSLRGSFIVTLWSIYESALLDIAEVLRVETRPSVLPMNTRSLGVLSAANQYYRRRFSFTRTGSPTERAQIQRIYRLRNAFAHGNGRRAAIRPSDWSRLQRDARRVDGMSLRRNVVEINDEVIEESFNIIDRSLRRLISNARRVLSQARRG